jgi:hypothetical protein
MRRSPGWKLRLTGFIAGFALGVAAWSLKEAAEIPVVMRFIAPGPTAAMQALERLTAEKNHLIIPAIDPGVEFLLQRWPTSMDEKIVKYDCPDDSSTNCPEDGVKIVGIGKSPIVVVRRSSVGSPLTPDTDLRLAVDSNYYIDPTWKMSAAKRLVNEAQSFQLFWWKFTIALAGGLLAFSTGIWQFFDKKDIDSKDTQALKNQDFPSPFM